MPADARASSDGGRDGSGIDGPGWAILAAGLLAVWLVLRSMAVMLADTGGSAALAGLIAPDSVAHLVAAAAVDDLRPGQLPTPAQSTLLGRVAIRAPLRYEPFFARTLGDEVNGRWPAALRAGEEARAREPRAPFVRALLLEAYLHESRYAAAIGELNAIVARSGTANDQLLHLLTLLADNPGTASLVERAMRDNPRWRAVFIDYAGNQGRNKALLFKSLTTPVAGVSAAEERTSREGFLRALVGAGDYDRAYLAWVNFLTPALAARVQPVYDGDFSESTAPAPFNWTFAGDGSAAAERTRDTGLPGGTALDVQFFGTGASDIASETLLLSPGDYGFSARASGSDASRFGGRLDWRLLCRPSGTVLPIVTLSSFPARPFMVRGTVKIPEVGCQAQQLVLHGEPGDVASVTAVQFNGLRLDRR